MQNTLQELRGASTLLRAAFRAAGQYRADFALGIIGGLLYQGLGFATVWVILSKLTGLGGWGLPAITLLYGMRLAAHALWVVPFNQLNEIENHVREGTWDRFLVRPISPLLQLITSRVTINALGDLLGASLILGAALIVAPVNWDAGKIVYLVLAIIAGAALEGGVQLLLSGIAFRTLGSREPRALADMMSSMFGNYPTSIFGRVPQAVLTYVLPVAFVAYIPASVLLERTEELIIPTWLAAVAPAVGFIIGAIGYVFWRTQLSMYQSSGT